MHNFQKVCVYRLYRFAVERGDLRVLKPRDIIHRDAVKCATTPVALPIKVLASAACR
jgi:hypothetical protein